MERSLILELRQSRTYETRLGDAQKSPLHGAPWTDRGTARDGPYAGYLAVTAGLDWRQAS